jgi:hypothetical protein
MATEDEKAVDLRSFEGMVNIYSVVDAVRNQYRQDPPPKKVTYGRLVTALVGGKVEMEGMVSGTLGRLYKLYTGEPDLDELDKMVLVRQRYDSRRGVQPWTLTFGRLLV